MNLGSLIFRSLLSFSLLWAGPASADFKDILAHDVDQVSAGEAEYAQMEVASKEEPTYYFVNPAASYERLLQKNPDLQELSLKEYKLILNWVSCWILYTRNGYWNASDSQIVQLVRSLAPLEKNLEKQGLGRDRILAAIQDVLSESFGTYRQTYAGFSVKETKRIEAYLANLKSRLASGDDLAGDSMMQRTRRADKYQVWKNLGGGALVLGTIVATLYLTHDYNYNLSEFFAVLAVESLLGLKFVDYLNSRTHAPLECLGIENFESCAVEAVGGCRDLLLTRKAPAQ